MLSAFLVVCLSSAGLPPAAPAPPGPDGATDWFSRMQELSSVLARVTVGVNVAGGSRAALKKDAARLAALADAVHGMKPGDAPDDDPTVPLVASLLRDRATELSRAVSRGDRRAARAALGAVTTTCVGCHTRSDRLAAMHPGPLDVDVSGVPAAARADLLLATHRFNDARVALDAVLAEDGLFAANPAAWRRAVTHALVLEVRAKKSPNGALSLVERVLNAPAPTTTTWDDAEGWQRSLRAWAKETSPWPTQADGIVEARRLLDEAEAVPRVAGDRSADVLYLRATAVLHTHLQRGGLPSAAKARALSMLSLSYDRLGELDLWRIAELYDEACIREAPHTDLARECFERLRDRLTSDSMSVAQKARLASLDPLSQRR